MFCGKYVTPVPDGYFEHLEGLRGKARASAPAAGASTQVANGGAVAENGSEVASLDAAVMEPLRSPRDREDIRYVLQSLSKSRSALLTNVACTTSPTIPTVKNL